PCRRTRAGGARSPDAPATTSGARARRKGWRGVDKRARCGGRAAVRPAGPARTLGLALGGRLHEIAHVEPAVLRGLAARLPVAGLVHERVAVAEQEPEEHLRHEAAAHRPQPDRRVVLAEALLRLGQHVVPERRVVPKLGRQARERRGAPGVLLPRPAAAPPLVPGGRRSPVLGARPAPKPPPP